MSGLSQRTRQTQLRAGTGRHCQHYGYQREDYPQPMAKVLCHNLVFCSCCLTNPSIGGYGKLVRAGFVRQVSLSYQYTSSPDANLDIVAIRNISPPSTWTQSSK